MYRASVGFFDFQDGNYFYRAGDAYPRPGMEATEARIEELSTSKNRMGYPLIQADPQAEAKAGAEAGTRQAPAAKRQQAKAKKKG